MMNRILFFILISISFDCFGQIDTKTRSQAVVEEGKQLYKSEMASWYGTDLFLATLKNRERVGGYFSYSTDQVSTCIFYSNAESPKVIGTIRFDQTFNTQTAKTDLTERDFTPEENDLYRIRQQVVTRMKSDTLFKHYNNTDLNIIPLLSGNEKKAYVLTGPKENGVVIFGNDYLLIFDNNYVLKSAKQLHKNIIPIRFDREPQSGATITMHTHLPETGDLITATDICTLMLYEKFTKWEKHNIISHNYTSSWNCKTNELTIIPMETVRKINQEQEKKK